jgi:hypothetical protein
VIYVDPLMRHGWKMYGREIRSCHLFTDSQDLEELHRLAEKIGMKRRWHQATRIPHYDLTPLRRNAAIAAGALEVDRRQAVKIWRAWRVQNRRLVTVLFRPLLVSGTVARGDRGMVYAMIDTEQPELEQLIALYHETLHLLGLKDEDQVEAFAQRLAIACPEVLAAVKAANE